MSGHFHVVEFIDGCLNDYDSGPIETLKDAREHLHDMRRNNDTRVSLPDDEYQSAGEDRYQRGLSILKIESCSEDCALDTY